MAAIFPIDTAAPWTFNGVTYRYDADEDRWFVISTNKTDYVDDSLETLTKDLSDQSDRFDEELENRNTLLELAADKNNQQDSSIAELDQRLDAVSEAVGALAFTGRFNYVIEKTEATCNVAYAQCLIAANGEADAVRNCSLAVDACLAAAGDPYDDGTFTSKDTNVMDQIEEFILSNMDLDGNVFDWSNLVETGDFLEFYEQNDGDTALYEVLEAPQIDSGEGTIRVKFLRETSSGDGNFNLQEEYTLRVFKTSQGLDLTEADKRYVIKPYVVYFADTPADITPIAENGNFRNGELWFDTSSLELLVWNNNSWVGASPPPSQDVVIQSVIGDVDNLIAGQAEQSQRVNSLVSDLMLENNIYYGDEAPTGDITGTLRNGDLWVDSDDLTLKFYTQGAWVNPDRQSGGDYLQKTEAAATYLSLSAANSDYLKKTAAAATYLKIEDYVPGGGVVGGLPTTGGIMTGTLSSKLAGDASHYSFQILDTALKPALGVWCPGGVGSQTKVVSRNGTALWVQNYNASESEVSTTAKFNYASYNLKAQNNVTYSASDSHYFKSNVLFSNGNGDLKAKISNSNFDFYNLARFKAGFVVKGTGEDIGGNNMFAAYPAYCTYTGRQTNDTDMVNKKYVDDRIAELEARITALGG